MDPRKKRLFFNVIFIISVDSDRSSIKLAILQIGAIWFVSNISSN